MPCKDTKAKITVRLDPDDRLVDFSYEKMTCSKAISGGTGYKEYCIGRHVDDIEQIDFNDLLQTFNLEKSEDQFLLYLEWDALRAAIIQYVGRGEEVNSERYQLSSISYDEGQVEICQITIPPEDMPKIISCTVRARTKQDPVL